MKRVWIVAAFVAAFVVGGCSTADDASREDAHDVRGNLIDKTKPHSVAFNNHYANVETTCLGAAPKDVDGAPQGDRDPSDTAASGGGWRVIITTNEHNDRLVLVQDPKCPGYVKGANLPPATIPSP